MSFTSLQVNDEGTIIRTVLRNQDDDPMDLTGASTLTFRFKKPDDTVVEKTATVSGSATDGTLVYLTEAGFLDQAGTWEFQVYIELASGSWHSDVSQFQVKENFA